MPALSAAVLVFRDPVKEDATRKSHRRDVFGESAVPGGRRKSGFRVEHCVSVSPPVRAAASISSALLGIHTGRFGTE